MDLGFCCDTIFFFYLFFVTYPPSSLNGTQPKPTTCSEASAIWKCMLEISGIPFPLKSRGLITTFFRRFCNLTAILTVYIFQTKRDIHNWLSALKENRGLLRRLRMSWTLIYKLLKIGPEFLPTLHKFCILLYFIGRLRRQYSTKLCQMVDSK